MSLNNTLNNIEENARKHVTSHNLDTFDYRDESPHTMRENKKRKRNFNSENRYDDSSSPLLPSKTVNSNKLYKFVSDSDDANESDIFSTKTGVVESSDLEDSINFSNRSSISSIYSTIDHLDNFRNSKRFRSSYISPHNLIHKNENNPKKHNNDIKDSSLELKKPKLNFDSRHRDYGKNNTYKSNKHFFQDLPLEWWERTEECKNAKAEHTERIDDICESREELILNTTLWKDDIVLEPNMFPYDTPKGIKHYTLWSIHDLSKRQIQEFVDNWLRTNHPKVRRWQYDDNDGVRSIDLFHVHVFIEFEPFSFTPRPGFEFIPNHLLK